MKFRKILSVLLAVVIALSMGVFALADSSDPGDGWRLVPTSPDGLNAGEIWFDFTYLCDSDATEEQKAALRDHFNTGTWYVNMADHLVKCESDNELNGVYTRSDQPYILCIKEVGVDFVPVHKSLMGIRAGDYYLDEAEFRRVLTEEYTDYIMPRAIADYEDEFGQAPTDEQIAQMRQGLEAQVAGNIVDIYWTDNSYTYNPGGTFYRYTINTLPVPWGYYVVDYGIARTMMFIVDALDASIRQADEATVAASTWIRVASSAEEAEVGGYYLDFTDTAAVQAAFGSETAPSEEDLSMLRSGEWYADIGNGLVSGFIMVNVSATGDGEEWALTELALTPEIMEALFALLKVKTADQTDDPGNNDPQDDTGDTTPDERPSVIKRIVAIFLKLINFLKTLFR